MNKTMSFCKVVAVYRFFFSKEPGKALKGKPDRNFSVDNFVVH